MSNNNNPNEFNNSASESLSFVSDEEALKEIDFNSFLEETQKDAPLFEGFHEDIEKTERSLEDELQSLYDDIMNSGPATIVPKPISVITSEEPEEEASVEAEEPAKNSSSALEELWMDPEEYFDIPVVSLDTEENGEPEQVQEMPAEVYFKPEEQFEQEIEELDETESFVVEEEEPAPEFSAIDAAKDDIFGMINSLKADTEGEKGFYNILTEIETNPEIVPVTNEFSSIANLLNNLPESTLEEVAPAEEAVSVQENVPVEEPKQEAVEESDFDKELKELLGDAPEEKEEPEVAGSEGFVINIPEDNNDYDFAANLDYSDDIPAAETTPAISPFEAVKDDPFERTVGNFEAAELAAMLADTKETKEEKKARKKKEKEEAKNQPKKPAGSGEIIRRVILSLSAIVIVVCLAYLGIHYIYMPIKAKNIEEQFAEDMSNNIEKYGDSLVDADLEDEFDTDFPDGMLAKYAPLYSENDDLRGWIKIEGLGIEYPIVQADDNDYYLKRDVYGKWTDYGVPFFDYRMEDFKNLHRNTVIYGHNMRYDDLIFGMLEDYRTPEGFKDAPVIECNTIYGDYTWLVYGVFITNSDPDDDNGYCLPYNFIDVDNRKFAEYIEEIDKRKFYSTGVDINENDKILTLSTCCYDFDGARLVVVARLLREGESVNTSSYVVTENVNPKYPQIWYEKNKKENTYADDARW